MKMNGYYLPGSCRAGGEYYLRIKTDSDLQEFIKVVFIGYRPNPAEVVVRDAGRSRMVYRSDLYSRKTEDIR